MNLGGMVTVKGVEVRRRIEVGSKCTVERRGSHGGQK